MCQHIEAETKWSPSCRWYFLTHFFEWQLLNFDLNFTEMFSQGSDLHQVSFVSDNGLVSNRQQAIIWTNNELFYWCIFVPRWVNILSICNTNANWLPYAYVINILSCMNHTKNVWFDSYQLLNNRVQFINSMRPINDTIWWHGSGSTMAQVMAWCCQAPSHYLNQYWLFLWRPLWHSPDSNHP